MWRKSIYSPFTISRSIKVRSLRSKLSLHCQFFNLLLFYSIDKVPKFSYTAFEFRRPDFPGLIGSKWKNHCALEIFWTFSIRPKYQFHFTEESKNERNSLQNSIEWILITLPQIEIVLKVFTFSAISIVKTTVKTLLRISSIFRSSDQGGMFGLSMARVMQLLAMKTKIMKSNQAFSVSPMHHRRNLEVKYGKLACGIQITSVTWI